MNIKLITIEQDVSIQCRAAIDTSVVNDYAARMTESDKFPPVDLYGTEEKCWIGDGWHRVMAAKQIGAVDIPATLHAGGRPEALKHALGANAMHGHRRSNADKRRCVEIALREFGKLSDRTIAEMCGVDHKTVAAARVSDGEIPHVTRTGADGKKYPAQKKTKPTSTVSTPVSVVPAIKPKPVTLRSAWMKSTKTEREAFLQWVDRERAKDLPRADLGEIYRLIWKLRRLIKNDPAEKNMVAVELGFPTKPANTVTL